MASFTLTGSSLTARTLNDGEVGFVGRLGQLVVSSGSAVTGSGNNDLIVLGNITSSSAVNFADNAYDFNGTATDVFVDAGGSIISVYGRALDIGASSSVEVINDGRILSDNTAISVFRSGGADGIYVNVSNNGYISGSYGMVINSGTRTMEIVNTGTISTNNTSIRATSSSGVELINSGTIASTADRVLDLSSAGDVVINTGTLAGRLHMDSGDDYFDGRNGVLASARTHDLGPGNDTFLGGAEGEKLQGGSGADEMRTGGGNDTIRGNDDLASDLHDGGAGVDLVDYGAAGGALNVNLKTGFATGGRIGVDTLISIENATTGIGGDTVVGSDDNNLIRTGAGADRALGHAGRDRLRGGQDDDTLIGGAGNDLLFGEEDNDRLFGDDGDDVLFGGLGRDALTGGAGIDHFAFFDIADSGVTGGTRDRILDFTQGVDKIDVSGIDANSLTSEDDPFTFIGTSGFTGTAGELRFRQSATLTIVEMDQNGDGVADSSVRLDGVINLIEGDFIL